MEEEKYQEYVKKFFSIKENFEKEDISLAEDLMKNISETIENIKIK